MPYNLAARRISELYQTNNITRETPIRAIVQNISPGVRILIPGKKYKQLGTTDYRVDFLYYGRWYPISHADIVLDIFQKCVDNPHFIETFREGIYLIGRDGIEAETGFEEWALVQNIPNANLVQHCIRSVERHGISQLPFFIPIIDYPEVLFWVSLNEEVNYSPRTNRNLGGRKTAFKKYFESMLHAEVSLRQGGPDVQTYSDMLSLIERVKSGRVNDLLEMPIAYQDTFKEMEWYYGN